jgi:hypothetical protein
VNPLEQFLFLSWLAAGKASSDDVAVARLARPGGKLRRVLEGLDEICDVCWEQRPAQLVATHTRIYPVSGARPARLIEHVHYCADRSACAAGALTWSALGEGAALSRGIALLPDCRRGIS